MSLRNRIPLVAGVVLILAGVAVAVVAARPRFARVIEGPEVRVGSGSARMYVERAADGAPAVLGIVLSAGALAGLPDRMNATSRCHDRNGNGRAEHGECLGDYESVLELPREARDLGLPVQWATVNWNPEGHPMPDPGPHPWRQGHFDFHFFIAEPATIRAIRPGPCGELIDCEDFVAATRPLPPAQLPPDYADVGAAVAAMGNHLVDLKDPELLDPTRDFTRTFIFGVYDGRMIFLEPMVSLAYLQSRPDGCAPVRAPAAWATPGYYPTRYCVRYRAADDTYRITLEGLTRSAGS